MGERSFFGRITEVAFTLIAGMAEDCRLSDSDVIVTIFIRMEIGQEPNHRQRRTLKAPWLEELLIESFPKRISFLEHHHQQQQSRAPISDEIDC